MTRFVVGESRGAGRAGDIDTLITDQLQLMYCNIIYAASICYLRVQGESEAEREKKRERKRKRGIKKEKYIYLSKCSFTSTCRHTSFLQSSCFVLEIL